MENNLYICINYKARGEIKGEDYNLSIKKEAINTSNKYLIGGGVYHRNGGKLVYKARNMKEAREFAEKNVFNKHKENKFEEVKRNIVILPVK